LKHKKGILLFPKERKTELVELTPELEKKVENILAEIEELVSAPHPPPAVRIKYCRSCSFQEFCWA